MPSDELFVQVEGRRLRVTNLDKVVYPETGTTKGEVIAYYTQIAPQLLPGLAGRPVTRKRWVEGVGTADAPEQSFFTKQLERGAPSWLPRQAIMHSDGPKEYPLVTEVPALVWLAQVAALELHVPQWRFTTEGLPGNPDRLVLDLDPGPGATLADCADIARIAREILGGMGMEPVPVTSGSKGIHLYAPLSGRQTSDDASLLARTLAEAIEKEHPERVTSIMAKAKRTGRVFVDWSQNNGKKTTIAPYSLRGRAHPTVAAPRTWDELDDPDLTQLTFEEVLARAAEGIDPFASWSQRVQQASQGPDAAAHPDSARATRATPRSRSNTARTTPIRSNPTRRGAHTGPLRPMLADRGTPALARRLGGEEPWVEIKWDGIRALGSWRAGGMRLYARSGIEITDRYPELTADGRPALPVEGAVIDGEIVAFDASGRPSFARLQERMHLVRAREIEREVVRTPITYMLFDLLELDGRDLTALPLRDRHTLLTELIDELEAPMRVPPVLHDLDEALEASRTWGLEGVVVKDPASPYRPGARSSSWIKLTHTRTQEVVIIGIRPGKGDRAGRIGSLLLAVPDASGLRYVGRVGTGFTDRMLTQLEAMLEPLAASQSAAEGVPAPDAADARWVRPQLVAEVEFADWTRHGNLRHPRWRGLRPDKSPADIVAE